MSAERGGVIGWLVMSFLAVSVALVLGCVLLVHTFKVREARDGKDVRVDTPFGSVHVTHNASGQPETAGLPVYPGAKPYRQRENAVVDLSSASGEEDLHIVAGRWETADSIDKVRQFYEQRFPEMSVIQHDRDVEMHRVSGRSKRVIHLRERNGGTEISLASVGEPKAN